MALKTRGMTTGNKRVDYTKIREDLRNISPAVAATLRNAVPKNGVAPEQNEGQVRTSVNQYKLERLSNIISNNINAVTDLRAITPYIDKAELIWQAILFYPNGRQEKIITYDTQSSRYKNATLHTELLTVWDNYFTNDYKIEKDLPKYSSDILWNTGSYTLFNLSRPGLDYLINGSELDPNGHMSREGNEAFVTKARSALAEEFVMEGNVQLMKNKGAFVRCPYKEEEKNSRVSGLEALLGNRPSFTGTEFRIFDSKEDPEGDINITLTDNPAILYLQRFNEVNRVHDVKSVMGIESFESVIQAALEDAEAMQKEKAKDEEGRGAKPKKDDKGRATTLNLDEKQMDQLNRSLFPTRHVDHRSMQYVKSNDSLSVQPYGRGLTFHIPSEAVAVIHYNGNGNQRDDYILLLDEEGSFLKATNDVEYYQSLAQNKASIANKNKVGSDNHLISNLRAIQNGKECDFDMREFAEIAKNNIIRRFLSSIISGKGESVSITLDEETNKIFLARMFKRQGVRCLYVPGECITYMAFKYNRLGIGQSLTQIAKMHIARLAAFDIADTLANLERAQPHTLMNISIEKEDPNPDQTIAIARQTFFDVNPRLHSLLSTAQLSVPQIVDALRESSLSIKVNAGDNAHLPAPDFSLEPLEKNIFQPVEESSRTNTLNQIANYFHLPRSWLDVSEDQNNFQIEAITEHDMVKNQGVNWQAKLAEFIIDFERKHARVNAPLMKDLVNVIASNKKLWVPDSKEKIEGSDAQIIQLLLADFFNNITCSLPEPTSTESTNKLIDSLEAVDKLVQAWEDLSGDQKVLEQMMKQLGIDNENYNLDEVKSSIKSVLKAEAFRRYNLPMPFDEIINEGKGGGMASLVNSIIHQRTNIGEFVVKYITERADADKKLIKSHKKKLDDKLASVDEVANPPAPEENLDEGGSLPGAEGDGGEPGIPDEAGGDDLDGIVNDATEDDTTEDNPEGKPEEEEEEEEKPDEELPKDDEPGGANYNPFGDKK